MRIRPRFEYPVPLDPETAYERMRARIRASRAPWNVQLLNDQIEVSPHQRDLHFWSPYLKVQLREDSPGTTTLQGVFGPNVNLWTLLVAIYAVCFLVGATGILLAYSQWQLGQSMTGFAMAAVCAVIAALVWVAAQIGQRFAQEQMQGIYAYLIETYEVEFRDPPDSSEP